MEGQTLSDLSPATIQKQPSLGSQPSTHRLSPLELLSPLSRRHFDQPLQPSIPATTSHSHTSQPTTQHHSSLTMANNAQMTDAHHRALWAAMPTLPPLPLSVVGSSGLSSPSPVGGGDCRFGDVSRQSWGECACFQVLVPLPPPRAPSQGTTPCSCLACLSHVCPLLRSCLSCSCVSPPLSSLPTPPLTCVPFVLCLSCSCASSMINVHICQHHPSRVSPLVPLVLMRLYPTLDHAICQHHR
jgi:hypothetical protein